MEYNAETEWFYPSVKVEEHYTVTKEPSGEYAFHFTPEKATKNAKHAKQIAIRIVKWLAENNALQTLQAIGGDSTNVNTGWEGGVVAWVEKLLGQWLIWVVCGLHINELHQRSLNENLDGPTSSDTGFSGPLGKALEKVSTLELNPAFESIVTSEDLPPMPDEVAKNLSTDQKHSFKLWNAIRTGIVSVELDSLACGKIDHARWLTTANRFLVLWTKKHGFEEENLENLQTIVMWIVGSYFPMWFHMKIHHHWINGHKHLLQQIVLWREQPELSMAFTHDTIQSGAYYGHSEHVLQTLLCSTEEDDRRFAVNKILQLREERNTRLVEPLLKKFKQTKETNLINIRARKNPELDMEATSLKNMINWESDVHEPVLTCELTNEELMHFYEQPMQVPVIGLHTQNIERCVKQVIVIHNKVY